MCQKEQAWSSDEWRIASPGACLWSQTQGAQAETTHRLLFSYPKNPFLPQILICRGWGKRAPNP